MANVLAELQQIRAKSQELTKERARREAEVEAAQKRLDEIDATLRDEFGIEPADVEAELLKREAALQAVIDEARTVLEEAGRG